MSPSACTVCGSRRWRRAPGGTRVCEDGHVDMSYRLETIDTGAAPTSQLRVRRPGGGRRKERRDKASPRIYWGKEADYLQYELVVLLVRHQVKALRELWHLPPSFEIIVRDLLQLVLELFPLPPVPDALLTTAPLSPTASASGARSGRTPLRAREGERTPMSPRKRGLESVDEDGEGRTAEESGASRTGSSGEDEQSSEGGSDADYDVRARVEAAHESSTSSSSDNDASFASSSENDDVKPRAKKVPPPPPPPQRKPVAPIKRHLMALDALAVTLLGAYMVRAPFLLVEVIELLNTKKLPFLDFAYSALIPPDLRTHFNVYIYQALAPSTAPAVQTLHTVMRKLARRLQRRFGVQVPEANGAPVLWYCCKALGLSPTFYALAKALARRLDLHLSLSPLLAPHARSSRPGKPTFLHGDDAPAEVGLMACVLVAAKMVYFTALPPPAAAGGEREGAGEVWDAAERVTTEQEEGGEGVLPKRAWLRAVRAALEELEVRVDQGKLAAGDFDPLELSELDLDRYLDLATAVLADGMPKPKGYDTLSALPLPPPSPAPAHHDPATPADPPASALDAFPPLYRAHSTRLAKSALAQARAGAGSDADGEDDDDDDDDDPAGSDQRKRGPKAAPPPSYPLFNPRDITGVLPPSLRALVSLAARALGVSSEDVMHALGELELRLVRFEKGRGGGVEEEEGKGEEGMSA